MPDNNFHYIIEAPVEQRVERHLMICAEPQSVYELRSEEVQDVMAKMPSWFIRQGTTVLFAVMSLLVAAAYFIRFPDLVAIPAHIKPVYEASATKQNAENMKYEVSAVLPLEMVNKVKTGQQVLIKLPLYPFEQFGVLEGRVKAISANDTGSAYVVTIELINGLITDTNKEIVSDVPLLGIAEVLTSDKTILQRLFQAMDLN